MNLLTALKTKDEQKSAARRASWPKNVIMVLSRTGTVHVALVIEEDNLSIVGAPLSADDLGADDWECV